MSPNGLSWCKTSVMTLNDSLVSSDILNIPMSKVGIPDWLTWFVAISGSFSVKKRYQLLLHDHQPQNYSNFPWQELWRLKVPPRVKLSCVIMLSLLQWSLIRGRSKCHLKAIFVLQSQRLNTDLVCVWIRVCKLDFG